MKYYSGPLWGACDAQWWRLQQQSLALLTPVEPGLDMGFVEAQQTSPDKCQNVRAARLTSVRAFCWLTVPLYVLGGAYRCETMENWH